MRLKLNAEPDNLCTRLTIWRYMRNRVVSVICSFGLKAFAFALIAGALVCSAAAQNYMYGQASLQTGTKPSGVAVADFNGDGRPDVAVANQGDNTVSVMLTKPDGTFAPKVDYPVGNSPLQIVTSDFNGDGAMDLAVVNSADNTISVLFGVGDGTFRPQTTFPTGKTPVAITVGDFNDDRNMDLAIANQADDMVSVLLGDGKGAFNSQTPVPISAAPYYILAGDVNNDGKADLFVLAGSPNSAGTLFLLTSIGNGAFSVTGVGGGASIANIAVGDFNNDGNLDVAFANSPSDSVSILLGNGTGSFSSKSLPVFSPLGAPPQSVAAGDFNHDGNLDLAVTQTYFIAIYPGNGDGTFGSPMLGGIPSLTMPLLLVPADFNNDAQLDLAVVVPDCDVALILLGNGDGNLGSRADVSLPASGGLAGAVVADLNNDGKHDLAIAQFNQPAQGSIQGFITTLSGNGEGTFQNPTSTQKSDVGIGEIISGDFTGKGNADLASADVNANGGIAVFLGTGNGTFGPAVDSFMAGSASPMNPGPIAAGDFNRDGKMDLIVGSEDTGNNSSPLYVLLSQGDGTFKANLIYNLAYGFVPDVAVADLNHDGFLDLAVTTQNELLVFLGRGDGTFQPPASYTNTALFTNSVAVGDFNGDGNLDIVVGTSDAILFYAGNGNGTFQAPVGTPTSLNMITLVAGDFNGDGLLDLATEGPGLSDSILLGNGDGTFRTASPYEPTYYPRVYTVGDLNGDGTADLVQFSTSNPTGTPPQTASVWLSTPVLSSTASSLQFSGQNVGTTSSAKTILLSNAGNAPLSIPKIAATGDFSQTNTCANTLAIKDGCSIEVTFTPTANGPRIGILTLTDNIKPGTQTLALKGWAGPPDFVPSVSPTSVTVKAGSSASYTLVLTSGEGFTGTVQVSCSGAPSEANCTLSQQSVPLSANSSAKVHVTVSTTAASSGSLSLVTFSPPSYSTTFIIFAFSIILVCALNWVALGSKRRFVRVLPGVAYFFVLAGCGGGSGSTGPPPVSGTPPGTYTLTLTMVSGSFTHTSTLTLIVQ
jgi:hypothetical protein